MVIERDASGHIAVTNFRPTGKQVEKERKGYPVYVGLGLIAPVPEISDEEEGSRG